MSTSTLRTSPPAHFEQLIDRVLETAEDPRYAAAKDMWTRHNRLEKVEKTPVYVCLKRGSGANANPVTWLELIKAETRISTDPLEREIELQLRQKLYKHDSIPDDEVLLPTIWISAMHKTASSAGGVISNRMGVGFDADNPSSEATGALWGLSFKEVRSGNIAGAYAVDPVVKTDADLDQLTMPVYDVDRAATDELYERTCELVGGRLPVKIMTDEVGYSPTEIMISLMGMEQVLFGVIDRPEFMHRIMEHLTEGSIQYHKAREAAGGVDFQQGWGYRVPYEELPEDADPHKLTSTWCHVAAQSMCGISPTQYEEFVQPYHDRIASLLGPGRVYYHGCEDLTQKIPIIRKLPNLRRFHVSPWSNLQEFADQLGSDFVLEVVPHPDTLYTQTPDQMRAVLREMMDIAGDLIIDLVLGEIETTWDNPEVLTTWARVAQEVVEEYV